MSATASLADNTGMTIQLGKQGM